MVILRSPICSHNKLSLKWRKILWQPGEAELVYLSFSNCVMKIFTMLNHRYFSRIFFQENQIRCCLTFNESYSESKDKMKLEVVIKLSSLKLLCRPSNCSWMYSARWSSLPNLKRHLDVEKSNVKDYNQQDLKIDP